MINTNGVKTAMLMALLIGLLTAFGYVIGEGSLGGVLMFLVFGILLNFFVYWFSDKIVLAAVGAKPADPKEFPQIHEIVGRLSRKAGIPKPSVYIVNDRTPNAFATGRSPGHASVAVNTGLMQILNASETEGVLAHEITHIKNRDVLISTVAGTIAGVISQLAWMAMWFGGGDRRDSGSAIAMILAVILAPLAAALIQMAISRSREYTADEGGARLSNPLYLASALEKLEAGVNLYPKTGGNAAMEQMYIVNPFKGGVLISLFSTHPPIKDRVSRLRKMSAR